MLDIPQPTPAATTSGGVAPRAAPSRCLEPPRSRRIPRSGDDIIVPGTTPAYTQHSTIGGRGMTIGGSRSGTIVHRGRSDIDPCPLAAARRRRRADCSRSACSCGWATRRSSCRPVADRRHRGIRLRPASPALWRIAVARRVMVGFLAVSDAVGVPPTEEQLEFTEWPLMVAIAVIVAVLADRVSTSARHYATLYRQASERLVTAHEEERARLARELHDGVGQTLTAVILTLDAAERRARRRDAARPVRGQAGVAPSARGRWRRLRLAEDPGRRRQAATDARPRDRARRRAAPTSRVRRASRSSSASIPACCHRACSSPSSRSTSTGSSRRRRQRRTPQPGARRIWIGGHGSSTEPSGSWSATTASVRRRRP